MGMKLSLSFGAHHTARHCQECFQKYRHTPGSGRSVALVSAVVEDVFNDRQLDIIAVKPWGLVHD